MIKKYTKEEYVQQSTLANNSGQKLYIYVHEEDKEIQVPDYDEEGNIIGYHTEIIKEEIAELVIADINYYVCYEENKTDGTVNPDYEEEKEEAERERINMLSLTKREVFLALYQDKGITPEQLRAQIQSIEALIEFDYAELYYRGNPLIDGIGALLGYTSAQLDNLFIYKTFNPPEPEPEPEPEPTEEGE